jgi:hypothetical protein
MISKTYYFNNKLNDIYDAFINRMNPSNKGIAHLINTNEINDSPQKLKLKYNDYYEYMTKKNNILNPEDDGIKYYEQTYKNSNLPLYVRLFEDTATTIKKIYYIPNKEIHVLTINITLFNIVNIFEYISFVSEEENKIKCTINFDFKTNLYFTNSIDEYIKEEYIKTNNSFVSSMLKFLDTNK